ncbi:hypothetical protein C8Q80DRAFT_1271046 [Daedaleopsis nitida]|nr:hypothetical protein C8Q80DRAFT_1271046 [Daedaleopsis nitida]
MARPTPLNIDPTAMFAPADGRFYTDEDSDRVFAQQPFDGPDVPFDYLVPSLTTTLRPPLLVYGWRIGHEALMEIARKEFPDTVITCMGHPLHGLEDEETYPFPIESFTEENENYAMTLTSPFFASAVRKYLGIPADAPRYIVVKHLYDSKINPALSLTVGTNYLDIIEDEQIEKLQALIAKYAPNAQLQWHLDGNYSQWRRVASARGATKAVTRKKAAPAAQQPLVTS